MRAGRRRTAVLAGAVLFVLSVSGPALADQSATIDFEGLAEGSIVSSVSSGNGISGDPVTGSVAVFGSNPHLAGNAAMIFDAECVGGCTGDDDDLHFPGQGNVLIISEDLDSSDPDDADVNGAFFTFDFSGFGPGTVRVESLVAMDYGDDRGEIITVNGSNAGGKIELFSGGTLLATVAIPRLGNNQKATVAIGVSGVDSMKITVGGSGAIDDIMLTIEDEEPPPPPLGDEGCTPGFWKNHPAAWEGFSTTDDFDTVFGVDAFDPDITLMEALRLKGGGLDRLARHGTAALLNSAHSEVDYPLTTAEVIELVQEAIASGDFESAGDQLEAFNEAECDVEAGPAQPSPPGRP
ncbi:MAG: hypothetical protein ACRDXD_00505 [Acidimicrobiia bacterium]